MGLLFFGMAVISRMEEGSSFAARVFLLIEFYIFVNFSVFGIVNMELNDTSSYQRCFVCGHRNPYGLHLFFRLDQNTIVADFQPREEHQGFPGVVHGGIVAAVLDEALGRTSVLGNSQEWTMTGRLEVRYRHYVPYGQLLRVRATLDSERRRALQASGVLTLAGDESVVLAEGHGTFLPLSTDTVNIILKDYPELRDFFEQHEQ
jgi:acyl-coenzyme A thioesterase PaaI-like protein